MPPARLATVARRAGWSYRGANPRSSGGVVMQGRVAQRLAGATVVPPCPRCRSVDGVRPVAAVTAQSFAHETRHGVSHLEHFVPVQSPLLWSMYVEGKPVPVSPRLVQHLRPPRPPRDARQELDRHLVILVNLSFFGLALFLAGHGVRAVELVTVAPLLGAAAVLYAGWLALAVCGGTIRRATLREAEAYRRARQRWEALHYCAECGGIFQAGWRGCLAPRQVHAYLRATGEIHDPGGGREGQRRAWDR